MVKTKIDVNSPSLVEERQVFLSTFIAGTFGLGFLAGSTSRLALALSYKLKTTPAFNYAPGSYCYNSGSWSYQVTIASVIDRACTSLTSRALEWTKQNNASLADPFVEMTAFENGTVLTNKDGYQQKVTFTLLDRNGDKGAPWMTQSACVVAITTLLYDCAGSHGDTRGGAYIYGHDGLVAYGMDPTCVDSPGKKCGSNT